MKLHILGPRVGTLLASFVAACLFASVSVGDEPDAGRPGKPPALTATQKERLKERDRLAAEVKKLRQEKKTAEAIAVVRKMLAIEREVLGSLHEDVSGSLQQLAELHEERQDFRAARQARAEILQVAVQRHGAPSWQAGDARRGLEDLQRRARMTNAERQRLVRAAELDRQVERLYGHGKFKDGLAPAREGAEIHKQLLGEAHPDYATSLNNVAMLYQDMGDYAKAEPLYRQALVINNKALGEAHPYYAASLNNLAGLYHAMGDYAKAEPLYRQPLVIRKTALGETHPAYARSLNNLALLYHAMGDYAKAEPLHRQALVIRKTALGEAHPEYAQSLNNLAALYKAMGDFAKAEPLMRQALEIWKKGLGETHPYYAASLNNLAWLYQAIGDYTRAEPLLRRALEISKKVLGETHPDYATSLNNLAWLYQAIGDYGKAEPLYRQALVIRKTALGEAHPDYALSLNNLAWLYRDMGDYGKAEPLYRQALEIRKKALGEKHPDYAEGLNNLAVLYEVMGDCTKAEPLYRQALEIWKKAVGETHPDYAQSLNNLAALYQAMGDYAKAEPLFHQALASARGSLNLTSTVQSERQQLAMTRNLRRYLDSFLSVTKRATDGVSSYGEVLRWKGAVSRRQQLLHVQRQRPDLAADFEQLQRVSTQLAKLAFGVVDPKRQPDYRRRVQELTEEKERLESAVASRSAEYAKQQEQTRLTPAQLQAKLPSDAVLVDFLEYTRYTEPVKKKGKLERSRHVAAYIVRKDSIRRLELGPAQDIAAAVDGWRQGLGEITPGQPDWGAELRRRVWAPVEPYLGDARVVLVSPDGALTRFPFAALPGKDKGKYLIEERAVSVVPVPQLLPELLAQAKEERRAPSLLLLGDVDYGAVPGEPTAVASVRSAARGGFRNFAALPGTAAEIGAIKRRFEHSFPDGKVRELYDKQATEEAVRREAPQSTFLHLATHGFFAPPEIRSALAAASKGSAATELFGRQDISGFHPGLLSGVVLAGANQGPVPDRDDGILTALEVAEMDLERVELVTLSACETGLGETAGGEGVLGLQRAFQVAGAKTVVASLWQVNDAATSVLMEEFYQNLWHAKLPKLEALRQAQLTVLNHPEKVQQRWEELRQELAKRGVSEETLTQRGFKKKAVPLDKDQPQKARSNPSLWAAFVLSGDFR